MENGFLFELQLRYVLRKLKTTTTRTTKKKSYSQFTNFRSVGNLCSSRIEFGISLKIKTNKQTPTHECNIIAYRKRGDEDDDDDKNDADDDDDSITIWVNSILLSLFYT